MDKKNLFPVNGTIRLRFLPTAGAGLLDLSLGELVSGSSWSQVVGHFS